MEEEKMTIKLPKDFFFGAAMSGPQTEGAWNVGGRLRSYWICILIKKLMLSLIMWDHMLEMICTINMKKILNY